MTQPNAPSTTISNPCKADFERRHKAMEDRAISEVRGEFTRRVEFVPGYDHRAFPKACGGGGHGQHGLEIGFYLIGTWGAIQWKVWISEAVPGNINSRGSVPVRYSNSDAIYPVDLGYHWLTPQYEGQGSYDCDLLPSGKCFYDGSGLNAGPVLDAFTTSGPAAVWRRLEEYYEELVNDAA